jgi:anti-sigma factor RsiW
MRDDLEEQLRHALRPIEPGEAFTERMLARLDRDTSHSRSRFRWPRSARRRAAWIPVALAASVVAAVLFRHELLQRREERGIEAREQLIEALRVTSQKLDLAYRIVNRPAADSHSGV